MKYFLLYSLFSCSFSHSYCQLTRTNQVPSLPLIQNRVVYTGTINIDSFISKEQLFQNAEKWYTHNYETADNTLTIDNIADGKISGTGIIHINSKDKKKEHDIHAGDLFFTIDIISQKGGYAYKLYGIYSTDETGKFYYSDMYNEELYPLDKTKWAKPYREEMLTDMDSRIEQMITNMKEDLGEK